MNLVGTDPYMCPKNEESPEQLTLPVVLEVRNEGPGEKSPPRVGSF